MKRSRRAGLSDPTIPRKTSPKGNARQRSVASGPTWGKLVDYGGDGLVLTDARGHATPVDSSKVRYLCGSFGNAEEGFHRAPRPWKYAGDVPTVEGDTFLILYLDNEADKPLLIGGVRTLKPDDAEFFPPQPIGEDPNPARLRLALKNEAGVTTGHVEVTALDAGGRKLEISVGGATFGAGMRILVDADAGQIKLGAHSETHQVPFGEALVEAIKGLADDMIAVNTAIPTLLSVPLLNATTITVDAATSLASGAPYLSVAVLVE